MRQPEWGWASQVALVVKNSSTNAGGAKALSSTLGWEDPLKEGMTIHSSILAWRIPWTEEPGGLWSTGSQRVRHDWSDLARVKLALVSEDCSNKTAQPAGWRQQAFVISGFWGQKSAKCQQSHAPPRRSRGESLPLTASMAIVFRGFWKHNAITAWSSQALLCLPISAMYHVGCGIVLQLCKALPLRKWMKDL